jgi:hypothetical protein
MLPRVPAAAPSRTWIVLVWAALALLALLACADLAWQRAVIRSGQPPAGMPR